MNRLILTLLLSAAFAASAFAEQFYYTYKGKTLKYSSTGDKTCMVINTTASGDLEIPSRVNTNTNIYTVTTIDVGAFYGCSGLTSVTIPNSVTSIGNSAFYGCSGLTSVAIPNSVTDIGYEAFYDCSGLKAVHIFSLEAWCNIDFGIEYSNPLYYAHKLYLNGELLTNLEIPESFTKIKNNTFRGCSGLTSISIPNSVTSIGGAAFDGCSGLKSIEIPNSVTSIGSSAFCGCSGLTSVTLPNSVITIGGGAFQECSGLTSITIPNSVTSIGNYAFYYCSGLTSVTIPNSVTSIGESAFNGCSGLTSVTIPNSVMSIGESAFNGCSGLTSVTIPNSVTSIGESAFNGCSKLSSLAIGNGITSISKNAFANTDLKQIIYSAENPVASTKDIFDEKIYSYATLFLNELAIKMANDIMPWGLFENMKLISNFLKYSFDETSKTCTVIGYEGDKPQGDLVIPAEVNGYTVTSIGDNAFYECSGLTSVTIFSSVTSIGDNAFYECSGLTSVTIPNSMTSIGNYAFEGCSGLTYIICEAITPPEAADNTFSNYDNLWLIVPQQSIESYKAISPWNKFINIENIGFLYLTFTFYEETKTCVVTGLKEGYSGTLIIPSKVNGYVVTAIGEKAFYEYSGLTSVTIPNSVTSIGLRAFYQCSNMKDFNIADGDSEISFGKNALFYTPIQNLYIGRNWSYESSKEAISTGILKVTLGDNITKLPDYAFANCSKLTSVTIPNSVTSISEGVFSNCWSLASIIIPNSVTSIGNSAFYYCYGLTSVTIPNTVTSIGNSAFYGCYGLTSVTIPNSVTSIGNSAFYGCYGLTSVTIPNSVTSIGNYAFRDCSALTSITCEAVTPPSAYENTFSKYNGVTLSVPQQSLDSYKATSPWSKFSTIIGFNLKYSFDETSKTCILIGYEGDKPQGNLVIPAEVNGYAVTAIGEKAFYECSGLTSVTIPNSVTSIGVSAFQRCSGLTSITIPNSVITIGGWAFQDCSGLTSVTIPNSVTSIGDNTFYRCSGLTSVTIPNSVTSIGVSAFQGCSGLTSITIPNSVITIGGWAFQDCSGLKAVHIFSLEAWCNIDFGNGYSNPLYYAHKLYLNGELLKNLEIPESFTEIKNNTFRGCSGLTSISIPNSVTSIGGAAFEDCSGLKSIEIPNSVTSIGSSAFRDCSGLTSISIPNSVTSIGSSAFCGCSGLKSIEIPNSVTSIGSSAFCGCSGLTSVAIPNSVTDIGYEAFYDCSGLKAVHIFSLEAWCNIDFGNGYSNPLYYAHKLYLNGELLTNLEIPESFTKIKNNTFRGCSGLTSISIPNSVTSIGSSAFCGCSGLTSVTLPNSVITIGGGAFQECSGLTSITIPNSVTSIGNYAFQNCSGLTSVTIPNSVTVIGLYAFQGCSGLTSITCEAVTPPSAQENTFNKYDGVILLVPKESTDSYRATSPWNKFYKIEGFNPSGIGDISSDMGEVKVRVINHIIEIDAPENVTVEVYSLSGVLVTATREHRIAELSRGVYVVRVAGKTFKIAI